DAFVHREEDERVWVSGDAATEEARGRPRDLGDRRAVLSYDRRLGLPHFETLDLERLGRAVERYALQVHLGVCGERRAKDAHDVVVDPVLDARRMRRESDRGERQRRQQMER